MTKVVAVAQQKGGAGKTSLAIHLSVAWAEKGMRVAVVDVDPQESLTDWMRLRRQKLLIDPLALSHDRLEAWGLQTGVRRLAKSHDIVVLDTPPHMETEARYALRAADLALIPLQPSPVDLWAGQATIDLASEEGAPPVMVLNRVPPRGGLTETAREALAELPARLTEAQIGNRVAFSNALARGLGVTEAERRSRAAEEMRALAEELLSAWEQLTR